MKRTLAIAALTGAAVLGIAAPAQAHDYLISSTPEAGSTITGLPATFSVTTNEALLDLAGDGSGFGLQVTDAAGLYYGDGCLAVADATLSTGATLGDPGTYTLAWQVVSEDGHPVSGEFSFTWAPAAAAQTVTGEAAPPVCGVTGVEPEPTASAAPVQPTTQPATPTPISAEPVHEDLPLGNVLWIGGAILAVLVAGLVTLLVLGRKARKDQ